VPMTAMRLASTVSKIQPFEMADGYSSAVGPRRAGAASDRDQVWFRYWSRTRYVA